MTDAVDKVDDWAGSAVFGPAVSRLLIAFHCNLADP
jgi:hypothetical protein